MQAACAGSSGVLTQAVSTPEPKSEPVPESYRVVGFNVRRRQYTLPYTEPDADDANACRHEYTIIHTEPDER